MEVIPVIDLLGGVVVGAVRGEREQYRPIRSVLSPSAAPLEVARAFQVQLGLDRLYIADLDAIQARGDNHAVIRQLQQQLHARVLLDTGVRDGRDLEPELLRGCDGVILGTETLSSLDTVRDALRALGAERIVVSIDLKGGALLTRCAGCEDPLELARELHGLGVVRFILLDLDSVGTSAGFSARAVELADELGELGVELVLGGGVRTAAEIAGLAGTRVAAVLVATALHRGTITAAEVEQIHRGASGPRRP